MNDAAPLAPHFRADLERMEAAPLGATGVAGALHLGEPPVSSVPSAAFGSAPASGDVSPRELLAEAFSRIENDRATVRAWAHVDRESATRAAEIAENELFDGQSRSPIHGTPVGVKDIIDVAGMPIGAGSAYFDDPSRCRVPLADAGVVAMLRQAGAVIVGKTRTHEFAFGGTTPPTRNPHDLDRIPGGSSGGSAAAVAAGHVRVALGTDTGGSVRIPSSYCGTFGLVPSAGILPNDGVMPLAWSLDRVGLITAGVGDMVASCQALGIVGDLPGNPSFEGVRIGVPCGTFEGAVDDEVVEAVTNALATAERGGATLVDVDVPHQWAALAAGVTLILAEGAEEQRDRRADREDLFGKDVQGMLAMADQLGATTYVRAQRIRSVLRRELLAALEHVDVLATPTMPNIAPRADEIGDGQLTAGGSRIGIADSHLRYNIAANLAALPCGTQPAPRPQGALPIGIEWVAAPGADTQIVMAMLAMDSLWA